MATRLTWPQRIAVLAAAAGVCAVFVRSALVRDAPGAPNFAVYYTLSRLLVEGTDLSASYSDGGWLTSQIHRLAADVSDVNFNPPTVAWLVLPFTGLEYATARVAWTATSVLAFMLAAVLLLRSLGLWGWITPLLIVLTLAYAPLRSNFALGQVYAVMFALLVALWLAYRRTREPQVGVLLAVLLLLKVVAPFLWILLAVSRRWRALIIAAATATTIVGGSLPWLGLHAWTSYLFYMRGVASNHPWAMTPYQDVRGFIAHLFTFDAQWSPHPLVDLPLLAVALASIASAALVAFAAYRADDADRDVIFGAFVITGVLVSPLSLDYHYVILLLPIAILLGNVIGRPTAAGVLLLACGTLLIAADLPYRSPRAAIVAFGVFGYPKLYGGCVLWGLSLARAATPAQSP